MIDVWTEQDVQLWLDKCGLNLIEELQETFTANKVDGKKLLSLKEKELKEPSFSIESLGRRKNIIRAINSLKASTCRLMNTGSSILLPSPNNVAKVSAKDL